MDLDLKGKRALVTGGSKGIGRACAEALAREGCEVLVAARPKRSPIGREISTSWSTTPARS
jgi:NAD(P)-dependent dehydrogenase (short-subunit alcohol dehydrogenase family)